MSAFSIEAIYCGCYFDTRFRNPFLPHKTWAFKVKYFITGYLCLTSIPSHVIGLFFSCVLLFLETSQLIFWYFFHFFLYIDLTAFYDIFYFVIMFLWVLWVNGDCWCALYNLQLDFFSLFLEYFYLQCKFSLYYSIQNSGCPNSVFRVSCGKPLSETDNHA